MIADCQLLSSVPHQLHWNVITKVWSLRDIVLIPSRHQNVSISSGDWSRLLFDLLRRLDQTEIIDLQITILLQFVLARATLDHWVNSISYNRLPLLPSLPSPLISSPSSSSSPLLLMTVGSRTKNGLQCQCLLHPLPDVLTSDCNEALSDWLLQTIPAPQIATHLSRTDDTQWYHQSWLIDFSVFQFLCKYPPIALKSPNLSPVMTGCW